MTIQIKPQFLSKDVFCKTYPQLYYGVDDTWFFIMTGDDKVCGLTLKAFPNPASLLRSFKNHALIEQDMSLPQTPSYLLAGTPFQQRVWEALLEIPRGIVMSYQDLANHLQMPKAVRAVANAVGANPVSPLIPCHRIVGSRQHIGGYYWGLPAKVTLLREEGVDLSSFKGLPMGREKEYRGSTFKCGDY
ncbi:MAG: MGMT family protein [Proteobacteria bacterium]|nr:MGMT family protein [Pseudomonadota bacterium]